MFQSSDEHEQERLNSPLKNIPRELQRKRDEHWSTPFYEYFFTQIDEEKFAVLYHDGYSRPNKSVAELVSLLIIKENLGLSDQQLEDRYLFDLAIQNALGKEGPGDNICQRTFTNFRRRLQEYEEETGHDLMQEVFDEHRDYLVEEFDIDTSTQRMDTTFIEANIKQLCRIDLVAKVLHTFPTDIPDELLEEVPEDMGEFTGRENLSLSYQLDPGDVKPRLETLVEHAVWPIDRFDGQAPYCEWQSFAHFQRVIDEQCYRIPALEADDDDVELDGQKMSPVRKDINRSSTSLPRRTNGIGAALTSSSVPIVRAKTTVSLKSGRTTSATAFTSGIWRWPSSGRKQPTRTGSPA